MAKFTLQSSIDADKKLVESYEAMSKAGISASKALRKMKPRWWEIIKLIQYYNIDRIISNQIKP